MTTPSAVIVKATVVAGGRPTRPVVVRPERWRTVGDAVQAREEVRRQIAALEVVPDVVNVRSA